MEENVKKVKLTLTPNYKLRKAEEYIERLETKIKAMNQEIGELKSYISELEDSEKEKIRIERKRDPEWTSLRKTNSNLRKDNRRLRIAVSDLMCKINSLEKQISETQK